MLKKKTEAGFQAVKASSRAVVFFSPFLFIFLLDPMAIKIRNREDIKGTLSDSTLRDIFKFLQYADDLTLTNKKKTNLKVTLIAVDKLKKK